MERSHPWFWKFSFVETTTTLPFVRSGNAVFNPSSVCQISILHLLQYNLMLINTPDKQSWFDNFVPEKWKLVNKRSKLGDHSSDIKKTFYLTINTDFLDREGNIKQWNLVQVFLDTFQKGFLATLYFWKNIEISKWLETRIIIGKKQNRLRDQHVPKYGQTQRDMLSHHQTGLNHQ